MTLPDAGPSRTRLWLAIAGILLVLGLAAVVLTQDSPEVTPAPYRLASHEADGLLGLRLWLERMGYRVQTPQSIRPAALAGAEADLILLFPPAIPVGRERADALAQWAAAGHTLVVVAGQDIDLETTFGVGLQVRVADGGTTVHPGQPLLADAAPPSHTTLPGQALAVSTFAGQAAVPVLLDESGSPTLTVQGHGAGVVWYLSPRHDLTNHNLRRGPDRLIVPAILRTVPAGGLVYILNGETIMDGRSAETGQTTRIDGLGQWLVRRPAGWAVLLAAAAFLAYLYLQGRRLGPPVVSEGPRQRRAAAEYVLAMAGLMRRAGHRAAVARYQKARLKRRLGHAWQLSPHLADDLFVARLAALGALPAERLEALHRVLTGLTDDVDERALIERVAEAETFGD